MTGTQTPVGIPDRPVRRGADDVEALRLHGRGEGDQAAVGAGGQPAHLLGPVVGEVDARSEEHTSELQSRGHLVCRLLLEKKKTPSLRIRTGESSRGSDAVSPAYAICHLNAE